MFLSFFILGACISQNRGKENPPKPPRGYSGEKILKLAIAVGLVDLIERNPEIPDYIDEIKNVTYKQVGDISLQMDIYKRKDLAEDAPVIVFIHGGSWTKVSDLITCLFCWIMRKRDTLLQQLLTDYPRLLCSRPPLKTPNVQFAGFGLMQKIS